MVREDPAYRNLSTTLDSMINQETLLKWRTLDLKPNLFQYLHEIGSMIAMYSIC